MNRLGSATSPYLLQHADNPVDWWEWGEEAFAEARRRDLPVLISVGYAACHWCHVMAHESFEDEGVGRVINQGFVAVKVDREERPDVDAVYMTATQAMTGQGGWPMTVFATPDGQPFYCGTYFPRDHFLALLRAISDAWRDQRQAVIAQGDQVVKAIAVLPLSGPDAVTAELLDQAAGKVCDAHDTVHGGFGGAPKFPPHMVLLFLLRHYQRTQDGRCLEVVRHTCEAMGRGGLFDQVGGGFHRYTVDETWTVPHFEKMLYDNALLLRLYTYLWRLTDDPFARRIAGETVRFLLTDLSTSEGGFASALDADTEGVEGLTYAWNPEQLAEVLGDQDGAWVADLLGVTATGNFEHGLSVPKLSRDVDAADDTVRERWYTLKAKLKAARQERPQPERDDKVVAAWNGLAITALCEYARLTGDVAAHDAALRAGELLRDVHLVQGRLRRVSRHGRAGEPVGVLEDYGCVAEAFCALHQLTADGQWLDLAGTLLEQAATHFRQPAADTRPTGHAQSAADTWPTDNAQPADNTQPANDTRPAHGAQPIDDTQPANDAQPPGQGQGPYADQGRPDEQGQTAGRGFFDTADYAQRLITRPADPTDNATPSGLSSIIGALITFSALAGTTEHRAIAGQAFATPLLASHPRFAGYAAFAAEALVSGPVEVAVVTREAKTDPLLLAAVRQAPPGAVIVAGEPDRPGVPLLAGRPFIDGRSAAYVCRGFVCDRPVTETVQLTTVLT